MFLLWLFVLVTRLSGVFSFAITGVQGGVNQDTGERPSRQEFSSFRWSGAAFDLYILALKQFQASNQTALLSYYQIAGQTKLSLAVHIWLIASP